MLVGLLYGAVIIGDTMFFVRYHAGERLPACVLSDWTQTAYDHEDSATRARDDRATRSHEGLSWDGVQKLHYLLNVAVLAPVALGALWLFRRNGRGIIPLFIIASIPLTIGMALALSARHTFSDYATTYFYGDTGISEAAAYLNSQGHRGLYVAEGEVAYYMTNDYYMEIDRYMNSRRVHNGRGEVLVEGETIPRSPIRLVVARRWILDFWPGPDYSVTKRFGSILIIEYTGPKTTPVLEAHESTGGKRTER
jgi:hypothetical protein